jgi:hypothetical protein
MLRSDGFRSYHVLVDFGGRIKITGVLVEFICWEHPGHLIEFIRQEKVFTVRSLPFTEDIDMSPD